MNFSTDFLSEIIDNIIENPLIKLNKVSTKDFS